ncbi:hypothetical protein Hanom_Chr02g00132511 [Helianthus anomalus]
MEQKSPTAVDGHPTGETMFAGFHQFLGPTVDDSIFDQARRLVSTHISPEAPTPVNVEHEPSSFSFSTPSNPVTQINENGNIPLPNIVIFLIFFLLWPSIKPRW